MGDESLSSNLDARITAMMQQAVQQVLSNLECQSHQQSLTFIANLNLEASKQFKLEEIEFFNSELNQSLDEDNIISIDKEVWMRNIFIFT